MKICYPYIALDLDGTLLNSEKKISFTDYYAIRLFVSLGGKVLLASGRSPISTEWIAENLGIEKSLVAYNGAFVQIRQQKEFSYVESTFSEDEMRYLIKLVEFMGLEYITYEKDTIRINQVTQLNERWLSDLLSFDYLNISSKYDEYKQKFKVVQGNNVTQKITNILKFVILPNKLTEFLNIYNMLQDRGFSLNKTSRYIEITNKNCDKQLGLSMILEKSRCSINDIMVIGDSYNDVSMLKAAKLAVAVDNSPEEIKKIVNAVTSSNNNNGVAKAILKYAIR